MLNNTNIKMLLFALIFLIVSLVALNINVSHIKSSSDTVSAPRSFKLFQLIAPTASAFFGPVFGGISVFGAEILDAIINNKKLSFEALLFFIPILGATYYFSAYSKLAGRNDLFTTLLPFFSIIAFIVHPVGGQAALYSLFWLIPLVVKLLPENLFLRSLGATFTAHSIGSVFWLYLYPSTPVFWLTLIPVVVLERLTFAFGISASFLLFNNLFWFIESKFKSVSGSFNIEKKYLIVKQY